MTIPAPAPEPTSLEPEPLQITALEGNRAAFTVLLVQAVGSALLVWLGLGFIPAITLTVVINVLLLLTVFRHTFAALRADIRWRTLPPVATVLGVFVLAFIASRAWASAALLFFPGIAVADTAEQLLGGTIAPIVPVLLAGICIPLIEETVFRGMLMRGHERAAGYGTAVITTSLAFSLAHGAPASVMGILPLAYALARVVQHTGSFWSGVLIHVLNNSLALILGIWLARSHPEMLNGAASDLAFGEGMPLSMRLTTGLMSFALGAGLLVVMHFWLTPKRDGVALSRPGPWLSGAYVGIILFGVVQFALSFVGMPR